MPITYGLPSRLYNALVGALRSETAEFAANVDFAAFIEALLELGFRTNDDRTTSEIVVLWSPPKFGQKDFLFEIRRPPCPTAWPTNDQISVAQQLKDKFGWTPANFIQFNGALAYGSVLVIESDD
ncbi:hypothetical protein FKP32DRAFT_1599804 [Trametes sanguinea]|nr:hypothetical protein FKP32DRAFT_1599804 [Trametes sanguinea]